MKNLKQFIENIWDGDVSFSDATEHFDKCQLDLMEHWLSENPTFIKGLPEDFHPSLIGAKLVLELVELND